MPNAAVLGVGAVTPYGQGVERFWSALVAGRSGIRETPRLGGEATRFAALVPDAASLASAVAGYDSHVVGYAVAATNEALDAMALTLRAAMGSAFPFASHRVAVCVGTSAGVRTRWDL